MRRTLGPAVLLAFAACGGCDQVPANAVTNCQAVGIATAKTDILFVVDDSGSMATKQQILASNFTGFIDQLAQMPVQSDYQVAVTTTSVDEWMGTAFAYDFSTTWASSASCPATPPPPNGGQPYPGGALVRVTGTTDPCTRTQYTTGVPRILTVGSSSLASDFTQNASVGVAGSGKEQGLRAAYDALTEPILSGANAGFLRPGARLVLIIISDDDDCSDPQDQGQCNEPCDLSGAPYVYGACSDPLTNCTMSCTTYPVQNYIDFFKGSIAGEQRDVLVAGIISVDPATLTPAQCHVEDPATCIPTTATAEHAAPRYKQFVDAFTNGVVDSVCNCTFANSLTRIATLIGQEVPLTAEPADWRLLTVSVTKPDGTAVACTLDVAGSTGPTPDVLYTPPTATRSATLTFGGAGVTGNCSLQAGYQIEVKLLCAG